MNINTPTAILERDITPTGPDYETVRRVIEKISLDYRDQPSLEELAADVGETPTGLQKLFTRWAGLSPKGFLQAVTLDHARRLLDEGLPLLDAAFEVGYHPSPFGTALLMITGRGLAGLAFCDAGTEREAFEDMASRWPNATYAEDSAATAPYAARIFDPARWRPDEPLRVVLIGTDFQVRVWEALLKIPMNRARTYSSIAAEIGRPAASRAVGAAIGANPVSFVVPCHRALGKTGALTGYHWGLTRKRAMLGWEAGQIGAA